MGKSARTLFVCLVLSLMLPFLAHAQETTYPEQSGTSYQKPTTLDLASPEYDVTADVYYWATHVGTPLSSTNPASFGGEINIRMKKGMLKNFGLGIEYTQTVTGPRFVNTGGVCTGSFGGFTGTPVTLNSAGGCGLVSPGNFQFGGGKVKYFLAADPKGFLGAIYGDYFSSTGGRSAWGGGAELDYVFDDNWSLNTSADYNNVTGNAFPSQNLLRYQADVQYKISQSPVYVLGGYRGYQYTGFFPTNINGFIVGIGAHF